MAYISGKTLKVVKELMRIDAETCGNLLKSDELDRYNVESKLNSGELLLFLETVGEKYMCQSKTYASYHWHTHQIGSSGSISAEDILIPIRKRPIVTCLVFTIWGIWELHCRLKYDLSDEQTIDLREKYVRPICNAIINHTGSGQLDPRQSHAVQHYVKELNTVLNSFNIRFSCSFTDWRDIKHNYALKHP